MISQGSVKARELLKGAHRADADIILTANILMHIVYHLNIQDIEELYREFLKKHVSLRLLILVSIKAQQLLNFLKTIFNGYYVKMNLTSIYKALEGAF